MANLILKGTIENDAFTASGSKEPPTIYGKLEVTLKKGKAETIHAEDINIQRLEEISLLLLRAKGDKYDADIKYTLNLVGDTKSDETKLNEAKLNSTKILWINLENKKPLVKTYEEIKNLVIGLEKDQSVEEAVVEIMVLRRMKDKNKGK